MRERPKPMCFITRSRFARNVGKARQCCSAGEVRITIASWSASGVLQSCRKRPRGKSCKQPKVLGAGITGIARFRADDMIGVSDNPNALEAILLRLGARARAVRHADLGCQIRTAHDFAKAMGCSCNQVAKTLLLRAEHIRTGAAASMEKRFAAFCLALPDRLDLDAVRAILGAAKVRLASRHEMEHMLATGPGAVSPFMMGPIPLYLEESLLGLRTIFVSGGLAGVDIEIAPTELVEVTGAQVGRYRIDLARE